MVEKIPPVTSDTEDNSKIIFLISQRQHMF